MSHSIGVILPKLHLVKVQQSTTKAPNSQQCKGFTLLPVMLAMSLIAAVAFLLNRDNGMNVSMVARQMDTDRARYAAEAGLQAVNANVQSLNCSGYPISTSPITNSNFGGASYSAYATSASGNTTGLVSVGTYNGSSVTLTRNNVFVYQTTANTYTLQPDGTSGIDTYIDSANSTKNFGASNTLSVKKNQQNMLLKFDLSAFPAGSRPLSATLDIQGSGIWLAGFDIYRMTKDWVEGTGASSPVDGATWNTSNGSTAWSAGGEYSVKLNANSMIGTGGGGISQDITDLTAAWLSGQYPNYGVSINSNGEVGTVKFVSSDDSTASNRPKITFNYLVPCEATGPQDPPPMTTVTLNAIADSFNDSGAASANHGAATTIKVYYTPTRENRILMQFDTSSIPAGVSILSANLKTYVSAVASATASTKPIWANAVNEAWNEGAGNNTNKNCPTVTTGTSWSYKTGCSIWTNNIHPPFSNPTWSSVTALPTAKSGHALVTVNNKLYAIGGQMSGGTALNDVEEYNPITNTWTTKAPMPTARRWLTAAAVNNKIYVIGGEKNNVTQTANEEYDPATDTWTTKAPLPTARKRQGIAVVNNKIYVFGGGNTTAAANTNNNYEYNPSNNTWTSKKVLPTAVNYPTAAAVNGLIYVIGGNSGSASLTANQIYDPASNSWSTGASLPVGTDAIASATLGNKIFLIGGYQSSALTKSVRMYDTVNNGFTTKTDYPIATELIGAAAYNGYIYSTGGDDGVTTVHPGHYKFDPGIPTPVATAADDTGNSPLPTGFTAGWINFDLKPLVQEWVDGVRPNNGVVLYTEVADQFSINSRENSSNKPQLIVTYQ